MCSACKRPIRKPSLVLAGMVFGPVCAQRVRQEAGALLSPSDSLAIRERHTDVVRDSLTRDLFPEVQA
jgi:hypothetical protein